MQIKDLKEIAQGLDLQAAVFLAVERDGTVKVVTWGENKQKCNSIGTWANGLWKHAISIIPFQTVFGWGFGGVPTPADISQLSDSVKAKIPELEGKSTIHRDTCIKCGRTSYGGYQLCSTCDPFR